MATINAAGSSNKVNRIVESKSVSMLRYSDRNTSTGAWQGAVQFVSRLTGLGRTATVTSPFTIG